MSQKKPFVDDVVLGNVYDKYGTRNPLARFLFQNFLDRAHRLIVPKAPRRILEVGCGEGRFASMLSQWCPGSKIWGVDLSEDLFDKATLENSRIHLTVQSGYAIGFCDESFDLVVAAEVLEHLERPEAVLQEIQRVARRDVLFSVPREPLWRILNMARLCYLGNWGNTPGHVQHWSTHGFVNLVSKFFRPVAVLRPIPWTMVLAKKK